MKKYNFRIQLLLILILVLLVTCSQVFAAGPTFLDVHQSDWFYNDVNLLSEKGMIAGYPDGSFKPNDTVSFGQFISIATSLVAPDKILPTEAGAHWASGNYKAAVSSGLISPSDFSGDTKSLNAKIIREDMAYILVNLAIARGESLSIMPGIENAIKDFTGITRNRQNSVLQAYSNGLLTGSGGNFKPKEYLKRSEVAAVFCRVMDYSPRPVVELTSESNSGSVFGETASNKLKEFWN